MYVYTPDFVDIDKMFTEVASLMEQVQQVNCGGQFEWVDSVLVTALRCGHWLFITNCNFCK